MSEKSMNKTSGNRTTQMTDTDVLVVGGGPVGLALAIELGLQGRRCLLVERHDRIGAAPRAKTTNVRSRELMRRWGIADRLAAMSPFGVDYPSNVVFATRLAGRELMRFANAFYCAPQRDDRFAEHAQWVPQYKVEEVLRARATEFAGVQLCFSTNLEHFTQTAHGIEAGLTDLASGQRRSVRAAYLVGADGARSAVREGLGIAMEGRSLTQHHNIVFRSRGLAKRHALGPAVMYWLVNAEVPSVVAPLDDDDRWTFGCPKLGDANADPVALIRAALALGDLDIEILQRDEWTAHQLMAARYREGRVFLAGDACHLHPPFGGHGMNMGIGDAVDLGWKLGAVLNGWGGEPLLASYEIERRPVHRHVIDEAVTNLGHSGRQLALDGVEAEGPIGDAVRAEVATQILATKKREFDSLGVVLGSGYGDSPVLASEPGPALAPDSSTYLPSARPGARAPHAWLAEGKGRGVSLYDHFAVDAMTLLVTRGVAGRGAALVQHVARELGIPLQVLAPEAPRLDTLYGARYALIRPDQHVAWRGDDAHDACAALSVATGRVPTTVLETHP